MPQISDLTVKKADAVTDVVYQGLVPSAGDKSPAKWFLTAAGAAPVYRPSLVLLSEDNGNRTARRFKGTYRYPVWATGTDGVTRIIDTYVEEFTITRPVGMSDTAVAEAVAQRSRLGLTTLYRDAVIQGYAPT
jgi:hypothetical protein